MEINNAFTGQSIKLKALLVLSFREFMDEEGLSANPLSPIDRTMCNEIINADDELIDNSSIVIIRTDENYFYYTFDAYQLFQQPITMCQN